MVVIASAQFFAISFKLYENVFRLNVTVQDPATMQILYTFQQLLHNVSYLVFSQIDLVQVVEKLAASHTLHSDVNPLGGLEEFIHFNHVWVGYHTNNQELVPQKLLLFFVQFVFVYLFYSADFPCYLMSRIKYVCELSSANATYLFVHFCWRIKATVFAEVSHPIVKHLFISMIHSTGFKPVPFGV